MYFQCQDCAVAKLQMKKCKLQMETCVVEKFQQDTSRSSRLQMFFIIGVLKNIHRKTPVLESSFNKAAGLRLTCFSVNVGKFFKTALL